MRLTAGELDRLAWCEPGRHVQARCAVLAHLLLFPFYRGLSRAGCIAKIS
jgi:hypothetical protein